MGGHRCAIAARADALTCVRRFVGLRVMSRASGIGVPLLGSLLAVATLSTSTSRMSRGKALPWGILRGAACEGGVNCDHGIITTPSRPKARTEKFPKPPPEVVVFWGLVWC